MNEEHRQCVLTACVVAPLPGAHFTRHQHSHATSCRHFHLGSPQAPISAEFPLGHAGQPPQTGLATHLPPAHHPPLTALPAPPQFQDVPGPPFLPQALHQQYLIQQQLLEAQHRRILPHSRSKGSVTHVTALLPWMRGKKIIKHLISLFDLQKSPGAYSPQPSQAALRL